MKRNSSINKNGQQETDPLQKKLQEKLKMQIQKKEIEQQQNQNDQNLKIQQQNQNQNKNQNEAKTLLKQKRINSTKSSNSNHINFNKNGQNSKEDRQGAQLVSNVNTIPGDGLFCYGKAESHFEPGKYDSMAQKIVNKKTKVFDSKVENAIINTLEKQCEQLGKEVEEANYKLQEIKIQNMQYRQAIDNQNKIINEQMTEIMHLRKNTTNLENVQNEIRDKYNELQRNNSKLKQEFEEEKEKATSFNQYYDELKDESEKKISQLENKLNLYLQQQEELLEENEDLQNQIQTKQHLNKKIDEKRQLRFQEQSMKTVQENERKLEKMGKILEENAILQEKFGEAEVLRKRFYEKNQQLERENKKLIHEKLEIEKGIQQLQKRNKDLSVMKSAGSKVLEEKINNLAINMKKLEAENSRLVKLNDKYKKALTKIQDKYNQQDQNEDSELEEIEAKPQLFGPIDTGKF